MPLHVGLHLAIWVLLIGTTWEQSVKPPGLDLHRGGASAPVWSYGEVLAYAGSHLCTVIQAPLRS
jgi:hypothetical protein